jgi:hypothetical protein
MKVAWRAHDAKISLSERAWWPNVIARVYRRERGVAICVRKRESVVGLSFVGRPTRVEVEAPAKR